MARDLPPNPPRTLDSVSWDDLPNYSYESEVDVGSFVNRSDLSLESLFDGLNPARKTYFRKSTSLVKKFAGKLLLLRSFLDTRRRLKHRRLSIITSHSRLHTS